ncbi:MAG TPA: hypothetical protein VGX46_14970 [Vicinamibacterales bacterium]|nr:hypothetical protein [Vicinamibacterales bacterium]
MLIRGQPASYPLVTVVFALLIAAIVLTWSWGRRASISRKVSMTPAVPIVAVIAATVVAFAVYRWTRIVAWQSYQADMLIVIREATRRLLNGRTPYATYRSYDAPWNMVMPYGPALWGPFLVPQLLRLDFRVVTIIGELFVPVWCGVAAVAESARGRIAGPASWLAVLAALVLAFDVQGFTLIGHTPVYWPLLPLFAVTVGGRRWVQAGCLLGVLVVARTTMVVLIPTLLMAVWAADRRRIPAVLVVLMITIAVALAPFIVWDYRAIWDGMVLSYPRVMKAAVWPVLVRSGIETVGLTEWLLERHLEWLVVPAQVTVMTAVYGATWPAIRRGLRPLPWMALALLAFSMTTLYPVQYLYYDVLLLLVSGAMTETLEAGPARMAARPWFVSLTALVVLVFATMRTVMSPFPSVAAGDPDMPLRAGFARSESDGHRQFSWIVGNEAKIILPRSSAMAATIVLTAQSPPFDGEHPPQRVTAILNGKMLAETTIPDGWHETRFTAPRQAWWIGFNELQLVFSSTVSPREVGAGDDPRRLALGVSRVDVTPLKE